MVVWGGLTNSSEKKWKTKEKSYTHLNAEFQRIARRDKKAFLSDQSKEIEERNRMDKTRDLFLISSASVRSIPFLSFIQSIFAWNVPLVSLIFLKRSLVLSILFLSSISLDWSLRKAFLSLLAILWNSAFKWVYLSNGPVLACHNSQWKSLSKSRGFFFFFSCLSFLFCKIGRAAFLWFRVFMISKHSPMNS